MKVASLPRTFSPWFSVIVLVQTLLPVLPASGVLRYVDLQNGTPEPPYTNWATAAKVIQQAVDVALPGDEIIVADGVYRTGGRAVNGTLTNRVAVDKPLLVRSLNGRDRTIIEGEPPLLRPPDFPSFSNTIRCVYLAKDAAISGFTLRNGGTALSYDDHRLASGGGVFCGQGGGVVSNCVITGCSAALEGGGAFGVKLVDCWITGNEAHITPYTSNEAGRGGGTSASELLRCRVTSNLAYIGGGTAFSSSENCVFSYNRAWSHGGAAFAAGLVNCTVVNNQAPQGGGVSESWLFNSIVYYNTATNEPNHVASGGYFSCTTPVPPIGSSGTSGNISSPPGLSGFLLSEGSPCINAGNNKYVTSSTDHFGRPRIVKGTVDIGASEYETPASEISYAWLQQFGLAATSETDASDTDADGATAWHEWQADTNPTNAASVFRLLPRSLGVSNHIAFLSSFNRKYSVLFTVPERSDQPWSILSGWANVAGTNDVMSFVDQAAAPGGRLYRVRVTMP